MNTDTDNEVIDVFLKAYEGKKCKVISALYKGLLSCRKFVPVYHLYRPVYQRKMGKRVEGADN